MSVQQENRLGGDLSRYAHIVGKREGEGVFKNLKEAQYLGKVREGRGFGWSCIQEVDQGGF